MQTTLKYGLAVSIYIYLMLQLIPSEEEFYRYYQFNQCGIRAVIDKKEIAGNETGRFDHPWRAALMKTKDDGSVGEYFCGGVLIDSDTIITTASCLISPNAVKVMTNLDFVVVLGAHDIRKSFEIGRTLHAVSELSIDNSPDDIAVIKLAHPVQFNEFRRPACLPDAELLAHAEKIANNGKNDVIQNFHSMSMLGNNFKDLEDNSELSSENFCAAGRDTSNVWKYNLGSGLFMEQDEKIYVVGLVSTQTEDNCGETTNVARYADLIKFYNSIRQLSIKDTFNRKNNEVSYKWIETTSENDLPRNSLKFGQTTNGTYDFYVGKVKSDDQYIAAKLLRKENKVFCNYVFNGSEKEADKFEVLTGEGFEFKKQKSECALQMTEGQYIGKTWTEDEFGDVTVGTIFDESSTIHAPSRGNMLVSDNYEYLHYKC